MFLSSCETMFTMKSFSVGNSGRRPCAVYNCAGTKRVVVTTFLPGSLWLELLQREGLRVDVCEGDTPLTKHEMKAVIGEKCDAVIGQLTEKWDEELLCYLKMAGGSVYVNVAVGHNNVDIAAATKHGVIVGNTPGVLTETTAEMAVALTFAAGRRICESDRFLRAGKFNSWKMSLLLGKTFERKTVGVIGCGRIGTAYAKMMCSGHKMNVIYHSRTENKPLENYVEAYGAFLRAQGEDPVTIQRSSLEDLLRNADVVSIHTLLDDRTTHMVNAPTLKWMKKDAVLINTARGPVIDEKALVAHLQSHSEFRVGLDVYEKEPVLAPGLTQCENAVLCPHIGSATAWTREGMAVIAARNAIAALNRRPAYNKHDLLNMHFNDEACSSNEAPSIVNAVDLGYPVSA
eukprot:Selendium_serpulae@DN5791_c2_g1_i1.p1